MRRTTLVGLLLLWPAAVFLTPVTSADFEVPDYVKQMLESSNKTWTHLEEMLVTNAEYKKFKPDLTFLPKDGNLPAVMTEREAADYAVFAGKRLGVDFVWKRAPQPERLRDKPTNKGFLFTAAAGLEMDEAAKTAAVPAPPPGMVYVPEGPFILGSDAGDVDEGPQQVSRTGAYFIDKDEVSNAEFKAAFPAFEFPAGRENHPAIVTWPQANEYAQKVGKRLPTEAEWEKAARGTNGRTFPWGESYDPTFTAWDESYPRGTAPARPESPYGCVDMAGGAWEWTADWYKPYPGNEAPCDEYGETYKVIRGGASFNDVAMMRTTQRYYLLPNTTGHLYVGFRCVKTVE